MHKILLIGQPIHKNKLGNVGSGGGYVRNMRVYLEYFQSKDFEIIPCFHTSRKEYANNLFDNFFRLFIDTGRILRAVHKNHPSGIHVMAQYRSALPRELMIAIISTFFKIPLLYEIKAGAFINEYKTRSRAYKIIIKYILKKSKIVLVEGLKYVKFLQDEFKINSNYFPNVVPDIEVPNMKKDLFVKEKLHVLFVGYCYYKKGVYHLVDACEKFSNNNFLVELHLIGNEERKFKNYLNENSNNYNFKINRYGEKSHKFILKKMNICDIFCYPSFHPGEGHSNSINEAMMNTMCIITTKNGFLDSILSENSAFFVKEKNTEDIYNTLIRINKNRKIAADKAINGYKNLINNYTVDRVKKEINMYYHHLVNFD
jgi:glycosyltransferase involved in cell wall biosynthesis